MNMMQTTTMITMMALSMSPMSYSPLNKSLSTDKLSNPLIILTAVVIMLMMATEEKKSKKHSNNKTTTYWSMMLALALTFSTNSSIQLFVAFEASMIPTFILILGWGNNPERNTAAMFMMIYTLIASLPFIASCTKMMKETQSSSFLAIAKNNMNMSTMMFITMVTVFMVKMPTFMLHLWLPKAHVEAPASGSMILAGVLLKMGTYSIISMMSMAVSVAKKSSKTIMNIGLTGALIISIVCTQQTDLKAMIAYSSVCHMGTTLASIMSMTSSGMTGALVMMIAHGLCSSMLFLNMTNIYLKSNSRNTEMLKGSMAFMPTAMAAWFMGCALNMAAPPSINFLSEVMIFSAVFSANKCTMIAMATIALMTGVYSIMMFFLASQGNSKQSKMKSNDCIKNQTINTAHLTPLVMTMTKMEVIL